MDLREVIAEEFVIWEMAWTNKFKGDVNQLDYWTTEMEDAGVSADQFREASRKLRKELKWPPSPADVIEKCKVGVALPHYYREFKALPMPNEPPITPEQKKEVIDQMSEGGKKLFLTLMYGDEDGRIPRKEA